LEAPLKFSIPVMCILRVPGFGATICPLPPPMTDPLLPKILLSNFIAYLKNWIRVHQYAFMEQVFVPYMSRYKMGETILTEPFYL
jgi:hypothetical protein